MSVDRHVSNYSIALTEGIFRIEGNRKRTQGLIEILDAGDDINLAEESDVHVLCSLLKKYLRAMPSPIIPFDLFGLCVFNGE